MLILLVSSCRCRIYPIKTCPSHFEEKKDYFTETEEPIVEKLFDLSSKLKMAYQFGRDLIGVFDRQITSEEAKEKLTERIQSVIDSELTCFNFFIKTLTKHQEKIANYFIQRNSSGLVKGFNNKVKVLKRRCYGLSNATKLFQRLILDTLGMDRFAPGVASFYGMHAKARRANFNLKFYPEYVQYEKL